MNVIYMLGAVGISLLFLVVLFVPLEKTFPAKAGQNQSSRWNSLERKHATS